MVKRETNAVVGTLEVEDYFENGITYCRIDTQGVVARYKQRNWIILRIIFFLDISEQQSHPNLQLIQVKFITFIQIQILEDRGIYVNRCQPMYIIRVSAKRGFLCSILLAETRIPWNLVIYH